MNFAKVKCHKLIGIQGLNKRYKGEVMTNKLFFKSLSVLFLIFAFSYTVFQVLN